MNDRENTKERMMEAWTPRPHQVGKDKEKISNLKNIALA